MIRLIDILRKKKWCKIFIIYLRYLIGGAFVLSSIVKIAGERFTTLSGEGTPYNSPGHFFETLYQSGMYWQFLGWSQLAAGFLLMFQKLSTLGAVLFIPISINIFVITVSYSFTGTPYITGLMLLANITLLIWDHKKLWIAFRPAKKGDQYIQDMYDDYSDHIFWSYLGLILFATTVLYVVWFGRSPLVWLLACVLEGLIGLIFFNIRYKRFQLKQLKRE
jgi:hypothetical protein